MAMSPKDRTGMQFTYNQLNLPKTAIGGDQSISYRYDALGTKLKKQATVGGIVTEQDYIGGIEYSKVGSTASTIERIATEEGFLLNSDGAYRYYYNLTDHLGNVRSVIRNDGTATAPVAGVMQKQDYSFSFSFFICIHELPLVGYYPFGKTKNIATSINNRKSTAKSSFVLIKNKLIKQIISIFIIARKPFRVHQNR
ncbi:Cell well associated RhsD protein [Sphingobacterium faecium PCAi_F2.5]|nr:Cell well associated RhsD protein [Sphingobacterium faecium PCAi_F2.5]